MNQKSEKRGSLFAIFLTFALSYLGATIVFPILAPLFLHPENSILSPQVPPNIRMILLGIFLASFPLAQFIFCPLIGEYADRKGRKRGFVFTLILEIVGYVVSAIAIMQSHLSLLFLGRFIMGIAAGNVSICLSSMVDLSSSEKEKVKLFSYGSIVAGSTFVLGPLLGGKLSDPTVNPLFSPAFPMWIGAGLTAINLLTLSLLFKEKAHKYKEHVFDPIKAIHNIQLAFKTKQIRDLYKIYFFYLFSWNMIFQFLPVLLIEIFGATNSVIGDVSALLGLVWIGGTIVFSFLMHRIKKIKALLMISLIIFSIITVFIAQFSTFLPFFLVTAGTIFCAGGMWPIFTAMISNAADKGVQGKVMGLSQSIQSLSMMLAPAIGGFFLQIHSSIPFILSSIAALIAAALLTRVKKIRIIDN